jgi:hypothetical protein
VKALLATPLYDGSAQREFIQGLLQSQGLYYGWSCLEGQANISLARDLLVAEFLQTDCTTIVFIDADIGFVRSDLETLLQSPHSITGGLYPRKRQTKSWVAVPLPGGEEISLGAAPVRVKRVGTGFLRVERRVFEDLIASGACPASTWDGRAVHHFFPTGVLDGEFLSEDFYFCELARRAGHDIYLDPRIRLKHAGRILYTGA